MRKYSIIINAIGDSYVLIIDSWIEKEGAKTETKEFKKINLSLADALKYQQDFITENSK
ncbi:MAG TPA: hypothetical protein PLC48_08860 [Ferruginibacter sp.]|nr:hypothetical protein [Bacteroidales bacterium]HPH85560.1 hypothetical protein [Ferruginibacter sp.]